jgi:cell shape-determining protein MreC
VLAGVIGTPESLPYDTLLLDKGSDDAIEPGAPVYIASSSVIGIVDRVYKNSSTVQLTTTPGFKSTAFIVGPNVYVEAVGQGGGVLRIGVPQGIPLAVGEVVMLPGVESGIYGSIVEVRSLPTQPEQEAYVAPAVARSGIRLVSIGKPSDIHLDFERAKAEVRTLTMSLPEGVLLHSATTSTSVHGSSSTTTP